MTVIQGKIGDSDDFIYRDFSAIGHDFVCLTMENLVDKEQLERQVIEKILAAKALPPDGRERFEFIEKSISSSPDQKRVKSIEELLRFLMSGWAVIIVDGFDFALCIGVQSAPTRSIGSPVSEVMERGSEEGFSDRKSTRLNSSHKVQSRMPSSA